MLVYNKIILTPNLNVLNKLLNNNEDDNVYNCTSIYENKIAIKHYVEKNMNIIRIWRTNALFDYWYDDFNHCHKNFIASLDYTIYDTYIKIDYLYINSFNKLMYNEPLDEYETEDLIKSLINFVKNIAKIENKKKIIIDVHNKLRLYHEYYFWLGFQLTDRKSISNPFWIEIEINLE